MSVERNLQNILKKMEAACIKADRSPKLVQLLAVSKKQSNDAIEAAWQQGQKLFGENYVQEWRKKAESIHHKDLEWHLIGPLQKNKCKYVVGKVSLIHSVDSVELAHELQRVCEIKKTTQNILLQINLGDESTKSGAALREGAELVREIKKMPLVKLKGLMALPPLLEDPEKVRPYFKQLKECSQSWFGKEDQPILSMGTSHDFEIAIEEGSNIVRVGTLIFGERSKE